MGHGLNLVHFTRAGHTVLASAIKSRSEGQSRAAALLLYLEKETVNEIAILVVGLTRSRHSCCLLGLLISQIDADEPNTWTR